MKELYELKDILCEELKEYGKKGELSTGSLDVVDKLAHALKSVETIIAMEEASEYSGDRGYWTYPSRSYASKGGRMRRRDSMGRYSGDPEDMADKLKDLMNETQDEQVRSEIHRLVTKIEKM